MQPNYLPLEQDKSVRAHRLNWFGFSEHPNYAALAKKFEKKWRIGGTNKTYPDKWQKRP
jgi:hypothetical protein